MILISGILDTINSLKDKTVKLTFSLNELTPEKIGEVWSCLNQFVYLGIKIEPFKQEEENLIESLEADFEDKKKSPAQRLRGIFYRLWQQESEGYEDFGRYYEFKMNKVSEHFKAKLD